MVLRARKQHQRADLADAVEALVDQVRKAGTHFREGAELPAADAYLRADEPFEPPAAVLGLQRQGRDARVDVETIVREEIELSFDRQPGRELVGDAAAEPGVGIPRIADVQRRELPADLQAACVGLRKCRTRGKTSSERDRCDDPGLSLQPPLSSRSGEASEGGRHPDTATGKF